MTLWNWPPDADSGSGATAIARYVGYSTSTVQWHANSWLGIDNASSGTPPTIVNAVQTRITRAGADWTCTDAGDYVFDFTTNAARAINPTVFLAFRLLLNGVEQQQICVAGNNAAQLGQLHLNCPVRVLAGGVLRLEHVTTAQWSAFGGVALPGGELARTLNISIVRVR